MLKRPHSAITIRKKNSQFKIDNNNNNTYLVKINNNTKNSKNNINQSPKISSGKMRSIFEGEKYLSLLNKDEEKINENLPIPPELLSYRGGFSTSNHFKRFTSQELNELFNNKNEKRKNLKQTSIKNAFLKKMKNKKEEIKNESCTIYPRSNEKEAFYKLNDKENKEKKSNKMHEILKRPKTAIIYKKRLDYNIDDNKQNQNIKTDRWMPSDYRNYEKLVKNRKLFIEKLKENPFFARIPHHSVKGIKAKNYYSDIFCVNPQDSKDTKKHTKNNYYDISDIFNLINDETNLKKVGEKYLFNSPQKVKYTTARESNSEWHLELQKNSIQNVPSKEYNILVPTRKNSNSTTTEKIYKNLNDTDFKDNPIRKHKGISNFIDIAHSFASNIGKDYMNCYKINPNCFKKIRETCSCFGDLYLRYKGLIDKPFTTNILPIKSN